MKMKQMFGLVSLVSLVLAVVLGIVACATGPGALVDNACTVSSLTVPLAIDAALQYAVTQPAERAQIEAELYQVSVAVRTISVATNGTVDASAIAAAFSSKIDPVLDLILQPAAQFVQHAVSNLNSNNATATDVIAILGCVSRDVASATTPAAVAAAQTKMVARMSRLGLVPSRPALK